MRRFEQFSTEPLGEAGEETAVDTQLEVDLICGGVGFDDGPTEGSQQWRERRRQKKETTGAKEGGSSHVGT